VKASASLLLTVYLHAKPGAYEGWDRPQLRQFKRRLEKVKGQWLVTLDDSPFNRDLFSDCQIESVTTRNGCVNNRLHGATRFGELIITP
jgi:DNA adenine methylase